MDLEKPKLTGIYQTFVVIWAALLVSQLMFLVVLYFSKPDIFKFDLTLPMLDENAPIVIALAVVALISVGLSFVFKKRYREQAIAEQKVEVLQTGQIVAMALCEASTLFGLVLAFAFDYQYFFLWFVLGIIGMLLHFPKFSDVLAATYRSNLDNLQ
jgi:hypothetical protein